MAIDETGPPSGSVGAAEGTGDEGAASRASSDEFRLRLDSPLFHRDLGMSAASRAPQLRELTWEHVVRPTGGQALLDGNGGDDPAERSDLLLGLLPVSPASTPTIESLLGTREAAAPSPVPADATPANPAAAPSTPGVGPAAGPVSGELPVLAPLPTLPPSERPRLSSLASVLSNELPVTPSRSASGELPVIEPVSGSAAEVQPAPAPDPLADQMLAIIAGQAQTGRDDTGQTRRPDTMVNNLAALIVNNTPAGGQPPVLGSAVETPASVSEPTADAATFAEAGLPATQSRPAASAALLRALEALDEGRDDGAAEQPAAAPVTRNDPSSYSLRVSGEHSLMDSGQFARVRFDHTPSGAVPVVSDQRSASTPVASNVEAELNRLAFLPDQEDEVGPVVVPPIAHSDQSPPPAAAPSLSQHEMYQPRQVGPIVTARASFVDVASTFSPPRPKRKRSGLGGLLSFILLLGLLGGAVVAAKYYLLDPRWSDSVEKLAGEVETARGLKFDHALTVEALPVDEYVLKLANHSLGITTSNEDQLAATWRSLGVLNGVYNANVLGLSALADAPAFYDPGNETIFVAQGLPAELYTFAMHRALTLALLDQHYGFSKRLDKAGLSVKAGTLALYDGDALAIAASLTDGATRTALLTQIFTLHTTYQIPASPAPYLSTFIGRPGVALMPYVQSLTPEARDVAEKDAAVTDGQALDLRRLVGRPAEASTKDTFGALFWYHALASRLDNNQAWQAALAWQTDTVSSVSSLSAVCVVAEVVVAGAPTDAAAQAFQAWAAAAPAAAGTQIAAAPDGTNTKLTIHVCDPGAGVPTNDGRGYLALGGAPLRAQQYLNLVRAQPTVPAVQLACAVYGGDPLSSNDERGVIDGADAWPAPSGHPAIDPNRLGCAPAPA